MNENEDGEEDDEDESEEDKNKFSSIPCASCGIVFGIPAHYEKHRRDDQKTFTCPNGHPLGFYIGQKDRTSLQTEINRLTKEVSELKLANIRLEAKLDQAEASARPKNENS